MEWKVGEIHDVHGVWYQCVEGNTCNDCAFYRSSCGSLTGKGSCRHDFRGDATNVIFKKLEKVGGTFACRNMSLGCYGIIVQRYKVFAEPILTDNSIKWCDSTNETILIALINKQDMEEKNNGNTPLNVLTDKYVNGDICYDDFEKEVKALYSCKEEIKPTLKEFDLEAAKLGKPVCTRDGHKARIICFDRIDSTGLNLPIVALIQCEGTEVLQLYRNDGKRNVKVDLALDLMMLPSEKKEGWVNVYKHNLYDTESEAKRAHVKEGYIDTIKIEWEE